MQEGLFRNHKTFAANFYDPLGLFAGKKKESPQQQALPAPTAPNVDAIKEDEKKKMQKKLAMTTQTTYTSPLGINDSTLNTEKKGLLGG
jgi:hypothetical protein